MEIKSTKTTQVWEQGRPMVQVRIHAVVGRHEMMIRGLGDSYGEAMSNAQARLQEAVDSLQMAFDFGDEDDSQVWAK